MDLRRVRPAQRLEEVPVGGWPARPRHREDVGADQGRAVAIHHVAGFGLGDLVDQALELCVQLGLSRADLRIRKAAKERIHAARGHRVQRQHAQAVFGDGLGPLAQVLLRLGPGVAPRDPSPGSHQDDRQGDAEEHEHRPEARAAGRTGAAKRTTRRCRRYGTGRGHTPHQALTAPHLSASSAGTARQPGTVAWRCS